MMVIQQGITPRTSCFLEDPQGVSPIKPTTLLFEMRDTPGHQSYPETYHGTRMNQKALTYHTQLHEWNESQNIASVAQRHALVLTTSNEGDVYLPVKKMAQIEYWTKDVNKYYLPNRIRRPKTGNFMTIDVSKYKMKKDDIQDDRRVKSAVYASRTGGSAGIFPVSNPGQGQRRFFGTDFHSVRNNLVQSQLHYSAQRKDIYTKTRVLSGVSAELEVPSDHLEIKSVSSFSETSTPHTLDTSSSSAKMMELQKQNLHQIGRGVMQPKIVSRSCSNRMLNVISIDDCKLTCRYRPQTIKETPRHRETKAKHKNDNEKDASDTVKAELNGNASTEGNLHVTENGHDADDEEGSGEDIIQETDKKQINEGNDNNNTNTADPGEQTIVNGVTNGDIDAKMKMKKKGKMGEEVPATKEVPKMNDMLNFSSRGTSRTSFCRITDLAASSEGPDAQTKETKKNKKKSRTSQINQAINNLVKDRTVLKPMERDFDTTTAEFGRTKVEKSEGSEHFKKIHSKLRNKIDTFVDTHSALKTMQFYDKRRKNSATSSTK